MMRGRKIKVVIAACAALTVLGAAPPVRVPQAQIDAENARWTALGVHLPKGGIVLADPYSAPYSTHSFIVPLSWYQQFSSELKTKHDYPVDAAALRDDLPTLRLLMEKTYAGYGTAAARGWNWNRWFADWDKMLAAQAHRKLSLREAFAPWGKLEQAQLDNHSGIPGYTAFVSGSISAVLASQPRGKCTSMRMSGGTRVALSPNDAGQQPHPVQVWDGAAFSRGWYVSYPKRDGNVQSLQCGNSSVAARLIAGGGAPPQRPQYESLGDGIAYLRMPSFSDANDDALRNVLTKAQGLGKERVLLLDLRQNDGGNAPTDVLTNWFAESAIEQAAELSTQYGTQSCFRTALFFGLQQQLAAGLHPPASPAMTQFLQQIVDTLQQPVTCDVEPSVQRSDRTLLDHHFTVAPQNDGQTRIVAIVDNGCDSDCEYLTYILSGLPDTVIAGTSTYGVMGFTQPGYFVLPHSRVPFRLALSRTDEYGDGRSVDGYGITVDVLLPTPESMSRKSLLALAKRL
jgi:hypothetical protein